MRPTGPAEHQNDHHNAVTAAFLAARYRLLSHHPFYGSLVLSLTVCVDESIETACVTPDDRLILNPGFFLSLPPAQQLFLLGHEVLHPALGIFWRGTKHDRQISNEAHDHVIDLILSTEPRMELIPGCLCDPRFKGLSYEDVYATLARERTTDTVAIANPLAGDVRPDNPLPRANPLRVAGSPMQPATETLHPAQWAARARVWEVRVKEALANARMRGSVPGALATLVEAHGASRIPWHEILRHRLAEHRRLGKFDWGAPSRRATALGFYLPRETGVSIDTAVYLDTSASVSEAQLRSALVEVRDILAGMSGRLHLLTGDAEIQQHLFTTNPPPEMRGRGGTSFVPLFAYLRDHPGLARSIVIFTDTDGTMPVEPPPSSLRVYWCVFASAAQRKPPFGEVIRLEGT